MPTVYLSLGSNLGDRAQNLRQALQRLEERGVHLMMLSSVYETVPVGETAEPVPLYLNCVARAETDLSPEALLEVTQAVEQAGGRTPTFRWGPRVIDIDLLLYDGVTRDSDRLTIPHPRLYERAFALLPLWEIAPGLVFPDGSSLADRLQYPQVRAQAVRKLDVSGMPVAVHSRL
jgi:2-amino-4-hydroxy-6-hydroxymethyldihydropteridine diphosphokinase